MQVDKTQLINSVQQNPSDSQEIRRSLWDPNVHFRAHISPSLVHINP